MKPKDVDAYAINWDPMLFAERWGSKRIRSYGGYLKKLVILEAVGVKELPLMALDALRHDHAMLNAFLPLYVLKHGEDIENSYTRRGWRPGLPAG